MGRSADLAFYAIVFARGLVPRERLQDAMQRAVDGVPLERVLVQLGAITPAQCEDLVKLRGRLGRACTACGKLTFLLNKDQDEASVPCEHCGGRLRPGAAAGPAPAPPRPSGRLGRPPGAAPAPPAGDLREQVIKSALEAVEARLAQEDLAGFLKSVTKKASAKALEAVTERLDELGVELKRQQQPAGPDPALERRLRELEQRLDPDRLAERLEERLLDKLEARLTRRIEEQIAAYELDGLADKLVLRVQEAVRADLPGSGLGVSDEVVVRQATQQATQSAIEAVQENWDQYDLAGLPERVLRQVMEQLEGRLSALERGSATDSEVARVTDQVENRLDLEELRHRLKAEVLEAIELERPTLTAELLEQATSRTIKQVERRLTEPGGLAEQMAEHVLEQLPAQAQAAPAGGAPALDEQALTERVSQAALKAVRQRLVDDLPRLTEQVLAMVDARGALEQALEALDLPGTVARLAGGAAAGGGGEAGAALDARQIINHVERRLSEFDMAAESVLQEATQRALDAVASAGGGAGGPPPGELIEQVIATLEDRNLLGGGGGEASAAAKGNTGVYDRKFVALAREVKQLKDSVDSGDLLNADVWRSRLQEAIQSAQTRDVLNSDAFKALLEARIQQALQGGGGVSGAPPPLKRPGGELVGLLSSPEFKQAFDAKINQVLSYLKDDLIPSAVKKALREVESR